MILVRGSEQGQTQSRVRAVARKFFAEQMN